MPLTLPGALLFSVPACDRNHENQYGYQENERNENRSVPITLVEQSSFGKGMSDHPKNHQ
jgi:hypothetical protein